MENSHDITMNGTSLILRKTEIGNKLCRMYLITDGDADATTISFGVSNFFVSISDDGLTTKESYISYITIYNTNNGQRTKIELYVHIGLSTKDYDILDIAVKSMIGNTNDIEYRKEIVKRYANFINERIITEIMELRVICGGI